jgi:hypothetical protein
VKSIFYRLDSTPETIEVNLKRLWRDARRKYLMESEKNWTEFIYL